MIIKILSSSATFRGVTYNTSKVDQNKGELMKVVNFGPLQAMGIVKPEDYRNYLKMLSAQNSRVKNPQFHAVISAKGKQVSKQALTDLAEIWLREMGYGNQPYLIVYHKDTDNNHVHIVTTRIDKQGKKISSDFENLRAMRHLNTLQWGDALTYSFSTRAQFLLLLECKGIDVKLADEEVIAQRIADYQPNLQRRAQLKAIFSKYRSEAVLTEKFGIDLVFHAKNGQPAYGYSIIDHAGFTVWKGSEIMSMKQLLNESPITAHLSNWNEFFTPELPQETIQINISQDVDDEAIYGRKRRKKSQPDSR
jgi:hypothetical protein